MKQETILIADDAEINRAILRALFEKEYNLLEAENGEQALVLLQQYRDSIAVVLLDLLMPIKDGYDVLEEMRIKKWLYHSPVVVITAEDSIDNRVKVFELGASDIIAKPFEAEVVKSRVKNIIELGRYRRNLEVLVEEQSALAREANGVVIDMLSSVIEYRSLESGQHIRRIRMFTKILLEDVAENYLEYDLDNRKIRLITEASSMHDIGKIAIPDSILNKPGKLTSEEFEIMKTHSMKGCEILSGLERLPDQEYLQYAYQICRYHHERWDGKGYPDGLKGNSIPICAQVVSIADCYDALTTDRVYRNALPTNQAFSMILNGECGSFSPRLLECFKNVRDAFAQLSAEYADGRPIEQNQGPIPAPEIPLWEAKENTLEQSQLKYFALLRYLDATVMEVDLKTGVFHLVYLQDQDFSSLQTGGNFEEAIKNFADISVHPEDKKEMLRILGQYMAELFDEGMTWRDRRYRIMDHRLGTYVWCRASILRLNLEDPQLRRVLLVWHKEESVQQQPVQIKSNEEGIKNEFVIDQLLGGIQKYRCDRFFTILEISRSMVDLLGYSKSEIAERFQNRMMELIYEPDRNRVLEQFKEKRNAGNALELEYRLIARDGRIIWVSDRCMVVREDGIEVAYGVLLNITQSRQAEENLRLSLELHNIIMDQTNDIIFEWDIVDDKLYLSSNWEKQYGYKPINEGLRVNIQKASHLLPEDMPVFMELMNAMMVGVPYKEGEFRLADSEGRYRWCKVRATAQFDLDGKPSKAVGVILDIDVQKRASVELEERASRDLLTGLYNKPAAQERIQTYLASCEPKQLSAMVVLDIDDFKLVNDQFGHMFGDAVLVEIAAKIADLFEGSNIIARIGGDEFLIFMPNIHNKEAIEQRVSDMLLSLRVLLKENVKGKDISCSIGFAFTSDGKRDFQELYDHADRALCHAKSAGKNRYMRFDEEMKNSPILTN